MIHPEVQKVIDYPMTTGLKVALKHYNWLKLDKVEELMYASLVLKLAKEIDGSIV